MKAAIAINVALVAGCLYLWFVSPTLDELSVCSNYTQLDREGVINEAALAKFHPTYGFGSNPRRSVPLYIAGPALSSARRSAQLGFAASTISLFTLCIGMVRLSNHKRRFPDPSPPSTVAGVSR